MTSASSENRLTLHSPDCLSILEAARVRFMAKVGAPDSNGCRHWIGKMDKLGYGAFCALPISKYLKAHRVAWILANGRPIPADMPEMRHSCDHPSCVEPTHLLPGTHWDNVSDAINRGRNSAGRGEGHRKVKLTEEQVLEIRRLRALEWTTVALGEKFGVGRDQISRICTGKSWKPESFSRLQASQPGQGG